MSRQFKRMFLTIFFVLTISISFAQIQGVTVNQKGASLPGTLVSATDSATNKVDTVRSDKRGFYSFDGLVPGVYTIEAKKMGYVNTIHRNFIVKTGDIGVVERDIYKGQRLNIILIQEKPVK